MLMNTASSNVAGSVAARHVCPASANTLDTSVITVYDVNMENQRSAGDHETKPRPKIEPKSVAQSWADYCALDHTPKTEFNPTRTAPMPQDRGDRGDRGSR
jgi:hypothetical protein